MTLASQFSLEEENFYKDIQDLVKNGSQNEKELSLFLQRYMDLLSRADLDEESFIINFTKAGLIIEASAKVYGTKVDRLWINLEHVLESLKNKNQDRSKKKLDCEEGEDLDVDCDDEEGKRKLPHSKGRRKIGDSLFSVDDFLEIDNITGLLGKSMNENSNSNECKLKLCEQVPNMFIKNKRKKKKIDVCLNKFMDDKDTIRLRDWVISSECLLIREIYGPRPENIINSTNESVIQPVLTMTAADKVVETSTSMYNSTTRCYNQIKTGETQEGQYSEEAVNYSVISGTFVRIDESLEKSIRPSENLRDERNNNTKTVLVLRQSVKEGTAVEKTHLVEKNDLIDNLNVSKESDVAKFPNVLDRLSQDCLVDVDEVFWSASKLQDVIQSKKMKAGKTNKLPCQLCTTKKAHKKRGKRCVQDKRLESLDSYFTPHVQPTVAEPQFGILPDEDLYSVFKIEMKLIEHLGKVNTRKNIYGIFHPNESAEELRNFLGFDAFEHCLMKRTTELQEDELLEENLRLSRAEEDNENYAENLPLNNDFELPFPVTDSTARTSIIVREIDPWSKDDEQFANSESEYQKLVIEELRDHYAAKTSFAKNKELGMKISKWHEMIADKIKLSQKRGALNMNSLARKIMGAFPKSDESSRPEMSFRDLVRRQNKRDIPRYFFACLQLTNEGNLEISKSNTEALATDCMIVTRLRSSRANYELDEETVKSPNKQVNSSKTQIQANRKRHSLSRSPSMLDGKSISKSKRVKQKLVESHKRPKNFSSVNNSKRRKCSISSDSFYSD